MGELLDLIFNALVGAFVLVLGIAARMAIREYLRRMRGLL